MLQQFGVACIEQQQVVVLTNTLFHNIDVLLVALIKTQTKAALLSQFQIPVTIEEQASYIDLLDIASVSAKRLKATEINLQSYRQQIKAGLDLLIDGF
ncbi:PemK-like, MazF-like toxin of type II toxin-antitoxin system [Rheinheimera pacifica]|uniref:Toxin CcdB n=1 Tax=Rheinheimera pacifica TaxID=173990 RepID=A0A1H6LB15_9GAMM|nr:CcdB family protein [Rheinheimera pacifica]SEH85732.1 PemK-like, MazF-like toxin of type II toxin-antitoxin system [Rheinheimera pacifica]